MAEAFGRHEGQTEFAPRIRAQIGNVSLGEAQGRRLRARQGLFAAKQGEQLILTIARDPGDADDFTAAHLQVDVCQRATERIRVVPAQTLHLQKRRATADLRILANQCRRFTDHHLRQLLVRTFGGLAMPGNPAAAQHRGAMAQGAHFTELVADKQNAAALIGEATQGDEQFVRLLRRQY